MKNARELVSSEIVYRMFSPTSLDALDDTIGSPTFLVQDYLTSKLQQVFLPWPLSLLHLLPNWMVITGLTAIILTLVKIFLDPCLAVCHLFRDSSMTIIDKITAACLPVITITRRNQGLSAIGQEEEHPLRRTNKDMEERIGELEKRVTHLQMMLMANKAKDKNQSV